MDKALYIAMSGAKQTMYAQRSHANNLANVNTTGFKEDFAQARSMSVFGPHYASRAYAMTERPGTNMGQGPLIETGNDLDVAVAGSGWIAVQAPDGTEAYSRAGNLQIDINGFLRNGAGQAVIGTGGPIAIPPASKIEIGADGTISVIPIGAESTDIAQIARIKLVNPDPSTLEKREDGLMHTKAGEPQALADASVKLETGFLEGSNVNSISALTDILALTRQYELQVKIMSQADQNSEVSARLLQLS